MTTKPNLRNRLHALQNGKCCYCGVKLVMPRGIRWARNEANHRHAATFEHLRRKADGGNDRLDNLALACRKCNGSRGTMSWVEFKTMKASSPKRESAS